MKLYFAFSNSVLLNQVNIQANISQEEADLLVWSTQPMDCNMVEQVKKTQLFRNVWCINYPAIISNTIKRKISFRKIKQQYYNHFLSEILQNTKYTEFIVAGFWNDTIYILNYLRKKNKDIKIGVCEEGLLNYYSGKNHENLYYMIQYTRRRKLWEWYWGGRTFNYIKKNIIADYLLAPDFMRFCVKNKIYKNLSLSQNTPVVKKMIEELYDTIPSYVQEEYQDRNVYFIAQAWNKGYDPVDMDEEVRKCVESIVPPEKLIIKTHTNHTAHRKTYANNDDQKIFVDREQYLFEILCNNLDLSNKIFILRNSTIALNLVHFYEKEPFFIFTNRLYSRYQYGMDDESDRYVDYMRTHMKNPERVLVPNSFLDLKIILSKWCKHFLGEIREQERVSFQQDEDKIIRLFSEILENIKK